MTSLKSGGSKSRPVIFLGPSLSHAKARLIFEADYRPPAKKGDLLQLSVDPEITMVGLVDGMFLQDYPPTPIEVYQLATKQNMLLAGAASLGALRAVELEKFGMVGIGRIFELYKKEVVTEDDEVAVTFGQGDLRLQSEAMIDIRFNLFLAKKKGVIGSRTKRVLTRVAKNIYFPHRNYEEIIHVATKTNPELAGEIEKFKQYISANRTSLKERDAIRLVEYLKEKYLERTDRK